MSCTSRSRTCKRCLFSMDFYFSFEAFQYLLLSISIDPGTGKHNPSHRILMLVRQRRRWFVLHMLPHWLFITAARYEERLHPSSSSNEFLHAELNSVSGHLERAVCEEDKDWAAIRAYYVTAVQAPAAKKWGGCLVEDEDECAGGKLAGFLAMCGVFLCSTQSGTFGSDFLVELRGTRRINDKAFFFHMVTQTNVPPLQCRQQPRCELCMYTNELCCCMLLWWLASPSGIDPGRVKT